ncbi:MAG: futalosine hydrolase [Bacteroidetes bacterium]|nr:futalosine hydrolase [Bacteroidota bacterium]
MNILIASATFTEIEHLLDKVEVYQNYNNTILEAGYNTVDIKFYVSGVGMSAMGYAMGKALNDGYDMALNIGIAGSFSKKTELGQVVNVTHDIFSELGAEDGDKFLTLHELNLIGTNEVNNNSTLKNKVIDQLPKAKGITVNTVHGNEQSIKKIVQRLNPDIESMEGAAFMFACKKESLPFAQIRSISNYVDRRNKNNWNIPLALENLSSAIIKVLDAF